MRIIAIALLTVALAACSTTKPLPPSSLNLSGILAPVPADIAARGTYRVPKPAAGPITVQVAFQKIDELKLSEEEKIRFITRLMRIINDTRALLSSPLTSEQLQALLSEAQASQAR